MLLEHLLKLQYWVSEREQNKQDWRNNIIEQRRQIKLVPDDSPSLKTWLDDIYTDAYRKAREDVILKVQLPEGATPSQPPYELTNALNTNMRKNLTDP